MIFPPDSFYAALDEQYILSQGDVIQDVPLGRIPDPLHICRPTREPKGGRPGESRYGLPEHVKNPDAFKKNDPEIVHARARLGLAMVVWQDCQLDKKAEQKNVRASQHFAGVAPIRPMSDFSNNPVPGNLEGLREHDNIRAGNRPPLFYVPPFATIALPEGCVDLRLIWPVQQSLLSKRVTTLSPGARVLLYDHLFWFFTATSRDVPPVCPHCGLQLPTDMTPLKHDLGEGAPGPAASGTTSTDEVEGVQTDPQSDPQTDGQ